MTIKKYLNWLAPLICAGALVACNNGSASSPVSSGSSATIELSSTTLNLAPSATATVTATLSGGSNVANQTISITDSTGLYASITSTPSPCVLSSSVSSCSFTVTALATTTLVGGASLAVSNSGAVSVAPSSIALTVAPIVRIYLPQTGQTPTLPITATIGMDGYTYFGVPWAYVSGSTPATRFTAGPNTACEVTDNLTGLIWLKDPSTASSSFINWDTALTTVNAGTWCGQPAGTWRLSNVRELASLVNQAEASQATWLTAQGFTNVLAAYYWSSTTYAPDTTNAWYVNMSDSSFYHAKKTSTYAVWPVRGGQ